MAMKYIAIQINVVKCCMSAIFIHTTFDLVYLDMMVFTWKGSFLKGPQGCNGCLDFGQAANVGLGRIIDRMEKNYRRNQVSYESARCAPF